MHPQRAMRRCRLGPTPVALRLLGVPQQSTPSPPRPMRLAIESLRDHIDALYLLALLYTGERRRAEEAVVNAMVAAAADPSITAGDPPWVWRRLASHLRRPNEGNVVQGSSPPTPQTAGMSPLQCETMALLVAGRNVGEVATLLDLPEHRIPVEFRAATAALDRALRSSPPKHHEGRRT